MQNTKSYDRLGISLRDLVDAGIPVDLSVAEEEEQEAEIEIEQVGGECVSRIFDLPTGLTGYTFDVIISNRTSRTIYCRELELRLPWEDSFFTWLADPREAERVEYYCFPNGNGPEYDREIVLNHLLLGNGAITQQPLAGLLLATGRPMPFDLCHGSMLDATLVLTSFDHVEHSAIVSLSIDRQEKVPMRSSRKYDLFGEPVGHDMGSVISPGEGNWEVDDAKSPGYARGNEQESRRARSGRHPSEGNAGQNSAVQD